MQRFWGRHEIAGLTLFAVAPDEDKEAVAGCNDVASLKARVAHGPLICSLCVLLVGRRRIVLMRTRVGDEFLRPAAGVLDALLPLLARQGGVGKILRLLRATRPRRRQQCAANEQSHGPKRHDRNFASSG